LAVKFCNFSSSVCAFVYNTVCTLTTLRAEIALPGHWAENSILTAQTTHLKLKYSPTIFTFSIIYKYVGKKKPTRKNTPNYKKPSLTNPTTANQRETQGKTHTLV